MIFNISCSLFDQIVKMQDIFTQTWMKHAACISSMITDYYLSKKHASKVRRYMSIHGNEEPIAKRLIEYRITDVFVSCINGDKYKACNVCNMTFSSPVVAQSHYQGKVHSKNLRLKTFGQMKGYLKVGYPCTVCNIELNSVEQYQAHISGSKHKNQ
uniref:Zinc finger protein 346 n=1 Tax=Sinocyclocheilus grahami TaxID=75366 RepID=A0A672KE83_SINGR